MWERGFLLPWRVTGLGPGCAGICLPLCRNHWPNPTLSSQPLWMHLLGEKAVVTNPEDPVAAGHGAGGTGGDLHRRWHCCACHYHRASHLHG